jgi:hypothetical protein
VDKLVMLEGGPRRRKSLFRELLSVITGVLTRRKKP